MRRRFYRAFAPKRAAPVIPPRCYTDRLTGATAALSSGAYRSFSSLLNLRGSRGTARADESVTTPRREAPALNLLKAGRPLIIGHRGYPRFAPENTLPSFRLGLEAGADLVELDYGHSRDGV